MASTQSDSAIVSCPGCKARFAVSVSMVGRRARCAACDMAFVVPPPSDSKQPAHEAPKEESASDEPQHVGFECRVCGTRMFGFTHQVGQQMKCEDCGALTVIPPPPKPKPKNIPAALEGEQYELWDPDEQPLPSEIIAAQQQFVAIECTRCGTLMHASERQVGQPIPCPDCRTMNIVPLPKRPVVKRSVLAPDSQTPILDPRHELAPRPLVLAPVSKMVHEEEHEDEYARAVEKSKRTGKPMEIDVRGRPILPRQPLLTGVLPFLVSRLIPVVWLALSIGFIAAAWLLITGVEMSKDMGAFLGMWLIVGGAASMLISSAAATGVLMQIVMESSEGNREIHQWPHFMDWFGNLLYLIVGGMLSALPGWALGQIPPLNSSPLVAPLLTAGSVLICGPIVLLSQLDINSPLGILSGRILSSVGRCPFSWALFYFECAVVAAVCGGITYLVADKHPSGVVWLIPLYFAALILDARLLGRLAWILAEKLTVVEERDTSKKYYER